MSRERIKPELSNITQRWVDLLIPFSGNYSAKLSASELARKSRIPQQTASRLLNKLAGIGLINYIKEGKNKLFYFDLEKQTTKIILNFIENQKALRFQLNDKKISVIINEILGYSESLIVFGSYASEGFNKKSDLDIVVIGKYNKNKIEKIKLKEVVEINEHYVSYEEFGRILKSRNPLAIEIMKSHVLFGDVSKIVDIFWRREYERR